ncbi:MAG: hypothetical protein ACFFCS_25680, partial [Candidatus Hodarchaeota archaeon]
LESNKGLVKGNRIENYINEMIEGFYDMKDENILRYFLTGPEAFKKASFVIKNKDSEIQDDYQAWLKLAKVIYSKIFDFSNKIENNRIYDDIKQFRDIFRRITFKKEKINSKEE